MELITSRSNPLLAHMRKLLKSRSYRRTCNEGISDGVKLLEEAIRWQAPLTAVVLTEDAACPVLPEGVRCVQVPKDVMASLSPMKAPQGALFTFRLPDLTAPEQLTGDRYLVLDGVQDPGNVGTIWRTADAAGYKLAILMKGTADVYAPKVVRAATGSLFRMPVVSMASAKELAEFTGAAGKKLTATCLDARRWYYDEDLTHDIALIIGNEGNGISRDLIESSDIQIKIPMQGNIESLNAAVAAGVLMYEAMRGKR